MQSRGIHDKHSSVMTDHASGIRKLIIFTAILTTATVWMPLADPVNLPKLFVLGIFAAWILGTVITEIISTRGRILSLGHFAVIIFIFGLLIATLVTDVKYTAFFGANFRNNGFICYFSMAILSIAAMMSFYLKNIAQIMFGFIIVSLWLTGYGFLQLTGNDPIGWLNAYGPTIATLGNPDFFSALLGTAAIALFWLNFHLIKSWQRVLAAVLLLAEIFLIYKSGSIQGVVVFVIGSGLLSLVKILQWNKKIGVTAIIAGSAFAIPIFLGLFGVGFLAEKLHRSSVGIRQDYWSSAINMFVSHPFFGVGIDRFTESYFQYAPAVRVVQTQATNNAHNVFLQFLSTGGLVLFLPYIFLLGVIAWKGLKAIKSTNGLTQFNLVGIFSIWFVLLLISIISIDNIGVAVWFWISGGVLYSVSREATLLLSEGAIDKVPQTKKIKHKSQGNLSLISPITSLLLTVIAIVIMIPAWKASAALQEVSFNKRGLNDEQYVARLTEIAEIEPNNVQLRFNLANNALRANGADLALEFSQEVIAHDHRFSYAYLLSAKVNEAIKKYEEAIPFRMQMLELNPDEESNLVAIFEDYLQLQDYEKAKKLSAEITKGNQLSRLESVAGIYEKFSKFASAIEYRIRASKLEPENPEKIFPLVSNYMKTGDIASARRLAKKIAQSHPDSEFEARAWDISQQFSKSIPIRLKAVEADPGNIGKRFALLYNYMIAGDIGSARGVASKISELKPASESEADAFEATGQYARALPYRLKLIECQGTKLCPLYALAHNYMTLGKRDLGLPLIEKIQQIDPQSLWAQYARDLLKG